jgi:hypothetical protein
MLNIFIFIAIGSIFFVLSFFICVLYNFLLFYKKHTEELNKKLSLGLDEALDLATSDQLLKEIRKRKNPPFILLSPIQEKDCNGISIESHSINSFACLAMLHLAREVALQNMKKKGENPQLPSLEDYFNED